uniref:Uncharacterized protein n=1 Tax=Solanum lycopersicum TaxID=4081 RepID=A0A3Q7F9Z6_SOLLC
YVFFSSPFFGGPSPLKSPLSEESFPSLFSARGSLSIFSGVTPVIFFFIVVTI